MKIRDLLTPRRASLGLLGAALAFLAAVNLGPALATETSTLMGTQNADNVAVTGGTIDNTTIGATTPAAGTFTTATVTTLNVTNAPTFTGALTVPNGGTGRATLTNHGALIGAGTAAITQVSPCASGQVLLWSSSAADPTCDTDVGFNIITNGGFALDQANEGSGPTPSSSTAVRVVDRFFSQWVVSTSGAGNPTISQAAIAAGNTLTPKELKITAGTAGSTQPASAQLHHVPVDRRQQRRGPADGHRERPKLHDLGVAEVLDLGRDVRRLRAERRGEPQL